MISHIQCPWREPPGSARPVCGEKVEKGPKIGLRGNPDFRTIILVAPGTWSCLHCQEWRARSPSFCREASAIVDESSREGHQALFDVPNALRAGAEPPTGSPVEAWFKRVQLFFSLQPAPSGEALSSPIGQNRHRVPKLWAQEYLKGHLGAYPWAHLRAPPRLGPGRKGQGFPMPRPPINPQARSSCSLWAWAMCFRGSLSPYPCWAQDGKGCSGRLWGDSWGRFSTK